MNHDIEKQLERFFLDTRKASADKIETTLRTALEEAEQRGRSKEREEIKRALDAMPRDLVPYPVDDARQGYEHAVRVSDFLELLATRSQD